MASFLALAADYRIQNSREYFSLRLEVVGIGILKFLPFFRLLSSRVEDVFEESFLHLTFLFGKNIGLGCSKLVNYYIQILKNNFVEF